jgi:WD40 repeat protein
LGKENWDKRADSAQFSSDGKRVLFANRERCEVWDTETGKILWQERRAGVRARALSAAGDRIAVLESDVVRLYDVATGRELEDVATAVRHNEGMATSGDYVALSSAGSGRLALCETSSTAAAPCAELGPDRVRAFAFDAHHKYLVWGGQHTNALTLAGRVRVALEGNDGFHWSELMGFSLDSSRVYAAVRDRVGVWSLPDGKLLLDARADGTVTSISCSPDGDIFAAGSEDGTAVVWTIADQQRIARVAASAPRRGRPASVTAVALSDQGKYLLTTAGTMTRIWALSAEQLAAQACARIAHGLTEEEWAAYAGSEPRIAPCRRAEDANRLAGDTH